MQKRPSNQLLYVVISIMVILGIYVAGSLLLEARQEIPEEAETPE
jgi:hypothetical protein